MAGKNDRWCFCWPAAKLAGAGANKAAMLKAAKWDAGDTITIAFLDGDPAVQQKVKDAAKGWTDPAVGGANLKLVFQNDPTTALVRISFKYAGSWSVIGTTCKQVTDTTQPTMNFGWLDPTTPDAEVQRVVLHEFGHAIGLIHEHQNPLGVIRWDRERVINDLSGYPNYWDLDTIERNMFQAYAAGEVIATPMDKDSIMMYQFPAEWTLDGNATPLNSVLSPKDVQLIRQTYP